MNEIVSSHRPTDCVRFLFCLSHNALGAMIKKIIACNPSDWLRAKVDIFTCLHSVMFSFCLFSMPICWDLDILTCWDFDMMTFWQFGILPSYSIASRIPLGHFSCQVIRIEKLVAGCPVVGWQVAGQQVLHEQICIYCILGARNSASNTPVGRWPGELLVVTDVVFYYLSELLVNLRARPHTGN